MAIGVDEGDGETLGDAPKFDGTDTVPTSLGVIVAVAVAVAVGVSAGVDVSITIGVGEGVSVGVGVCPNASSAMRKLVNANPAARTCFRITG